MNYSHAKQIADYLVLNLADYCQRIEIAGSVRRKKADPGDLELVVIPTPGAPWPEFGQKRLFTSHLDAALYHMECEGKFGRRVKNGEKYKQIVIRAETFGVHTLNDFNLDLFIVRPETWGVQFLIRTGSADFSHKCVTPRKFGGYLPDDCVVRDGRVWRFAAGDLCLPDAEGTALETPEEQDFLDLLKLGWIEPERRV